MNIPSLGSSVSFPTTVANVAQVQSLSSGTTPTWGPDISEVGGAVTGGVFGFYIGSSWGSLLGTPGAIIGGGIGAYMGGGWGARVGFKYAACLAGGSIVGGMVGGRLLGPLGSIAGTIAGGYAGAWVANKIGNRGQ